MRTLSTMLTMLLLLAVPARAQTPATVPGSDLPPAATVQAQARPSPLTKQQIEQIRAEIHAGKSDLIAKNISLTADEAAAFWPLYKRYDSAGKALNDKRFELLRKYLDAGDQGDPAIAAALLRATLKRDLEIAKLRMDYAPRFAKVLPKAKATRFMQIERALTLVADAKLAAMVPLYPWFPWPPLEE